MKTIWFQGAREEVAKKERMAILLAAQPAFEVLTGILESKRKMKESERNQPAGIDKPDYAVFQAFAAGQLHILEDIISLLDYKE